MSLEFFSATDVGRARDNNEDSVALSMRLSAWPCLLTAWAATTLARWPAKC